MKSVTKFNFRFLVFVVLFGDDVLFPIHCVIKRFIQRGRIVPVSINRPLPCRRIHRGPIGPRRAYDSTPKTTSVMCPTCQTTRPIQGLVNGSRSVGRPAVPYLRPPVSGVCNVCNNKRVGHQCHDLDGPRKKNRLVTAEWSRLTTVKIRCAPRPPQP